MLPNIAGAIDGSHIKIRAPRESAVDYFSRYQEHDVVVQAVVNGKKLFIDVAAGFPGVYMMLECSEIAVFIKKLKMAISFQLDQCT